MTESTINDASVVDVAIIGAGPAGLTSALYAARAGVSVVVFEELAVGGQLLSIDLLENYPGYPQGINGFEFANDLRNQAEKFGASFESDKVLGVAKGEVFELTTYAGVTRARTVIVATGAKPSKLPVLIPMEGRGVSYCATCDGNFYRGKTVVVIGGGDTACADSIYLSRICNEVHLVHRRDELRASKWYEKQLLALPNVHIHWNSVVERYEEQAPLLSGVEVRNLQTNQVDYIDCSGVFVAIGTKPDTQWLEGFVSLDERGYVITDEHGATSVEGLYAAGDIRTTPLRQVVTAASDGAIAAESAVKHLSSC